jgi:hypothetical protein
MTRFTVEEDTRMTRRRGETRYCIYDGDFGYDALIRVNGDFASSEGQREYVQAVCDALNGAQIPTTETTRFPWSEGD